MPLNIIASLVVEGTKAIPYYNIIKTYGLLFLLIAVLKVYFGGSTNNWSRDLHGRVVIVTGGTSGLGAATVKELAMRGAQIVLLVRKLNDGWVQERIADLREEASNPCIYAEEADLADFVSVRKFATKWLDNVVPRRLDMIICCAAIAEPPFSGRKATRDTIEAQMHVNYLAHFHLLNLLTPALRNQPEGRDVRVILTGCVSSLAAALNIDDLALTESMYPIYQPFRVHGASKLALSLAGCELQRRLNAYERKDGLPTNVTVAVVNPGMMRSPSFKRFVSFDRISGLLFYLLLWPVWWLFLKSSKQGAESMLFAICSPDLEGRKAVAFIRECRISEKPPPRKEFEDQELQKKLYDISESLIEEAEKKHKQS